MCGKSSCTSMFERLRFKLFLGGKPPKNWINLGNKLEMKLSSLYGHRDHVI